jgi:hypothetical protein
MYRRQTDRSLDAMYLQKRSRWDEGCEKSIPTPTCLCDSPTSVLVCDWLLCLVAVLLPDLLFD